MSDHLERLKQDLIREKSEIKATICKPGIFRGPRKGDLWEVREFSPGYVDAISYIGSNSLGGNSVRISNGAKILIVEAGVPDPAKRPWAGTWALVSVSGSENLGTLWISEKRWYDLPVPFSLISSL